MSAAVLFYGYSLGAPDDTGWAIRNEEEFEPDWLVQAEADMEADDDGDGYEYHMRRAVLLADEVPAGEITSENAEALMKDRCSMEIITFGHYNTLFYGLALTGSVYRASDWSPSPITPNFEWNPNLHTPGVDFPDDGYLHNALRALGMEPTQGRATWILAPDQ
jgi:hypothetical protein